MAINRQRQTDRKGRRRSSQNKYFLLRLVNKIMETRCGTVKNYVMLPPFNYYHNSHKETWFFELNQRVETRVLVNLLRQLSLLQMWLLLRPDSFRWPYHNQYSSYLTRWTESITVNLKISWIGRKKLSSSTVVMLTHCG